MNRLNTLLRTSLESIIAQQPVDPLASLESYEEYRITLEEHTAAVDLVEQLGDMSEGLIEIEGLVDESRGDGTLSEDQVALQVDAVNKAREVLDGDVSEISMESFTSIETASLEASDQSKGALRKMWDAFVAMLVKIKDAFKKIWQWIFGSEKRTKDAVKTMETASAEIKADERTSPPTTDQEKAAVEADKEAIAAVVKVAPTPESTKVATKAIDSVAKEVKELSSIVTEIEKEAKEAPSTDKIDRLIYGDLPQVPTFERFMRWEEEYNSGTRDLIQESLAELTEGRTNYRHGHITADILSGYVHELSESWKRFPDLIKDVSEYLKEISVIEDRVAKVAAEMSKDATGYSDNRLSNLRKLSSTIQKVKGDLMQFVKKTESGITKASSVVKTVASKSKARKGKK